jgi:superoxide reductase
MAQVKYLKPNDEPEAVFVLNGKEQPIAVYEYCNLHGLWKYEFNLDLSSRK